MSDVCPTSNRSIRARQHREGARRHRPDRRPPTARRCAQPCQATVDKMMRPSVRGCTGKGFTATQCHDITVYPQIGLAGGACEGYGMLLDISDPGAPGAPRRRLRLELLLLALGHVQQRRHEAPLLRRVGRRWPAEVPRDGPARLGRGRDLHDRERQAGVPELLQDAGAADRATRTASRTTAR